MKLSKMHEQFIALGHQDQVVMTCDLNNNKPAPFVTDVYGFRHIFSFLAFSISLTLNMSCTQY